ncbi:MAG: hypothetical protein A3C46_05360 [Deltaproteobacteria bacterium RIFCSPHIGHO2_02_FULL_44_16]|nr:MAG: hypothetical protein A3C46_05360 [Deltaproteobacteria bacterium RIFCSPHIGHO2_02_FULL_44_16]
MNQQTSTWAKRLAAIGIFGLCFGYFASYIPYSMMTKMITKGMFEGMNGVGFTGFQIQPVVVFASSFGMLMFITLAGWWKYTTKFRVGHLTLPRPQWFTFISGLCTAGVIMTTTLAYTFDGISIVFAMLLMRGGVLVMAPMIDFLARKRKRHIYWPSWVAAGLSFAALLVSFLSKAGAALTVAAGINIGLYLFSYFIRILFMSNRAKSDDSIERRRYFTEEQLTANIVLFGSLLVIALFGRNMNADTVPGMLWYGFSAIPLTQYFWPIFFIGFFSYGTGLFGSLIFLDKRENTFTVPANRASSVVSGVISTYLLAFYFGSKSPDVSQLAGVALILGAIFFLAWRAVVEKRAKARQGKITNPAMNASSQKGVGLGSHSREETPQMGKRSFVAATEDARVN